MMRPAASSGETAKSAFLPTKESRGRRLVHSYCGDGVAGVLELLAGEGMVKGGGGGGPCPSSLPRSAEFSWQLGVSHPASTAPS